MEMLRRRDFKDSAENWAPEARIATTVGGRTSDQSQSEVGAHRVIDGQQPKYGEVVFFIVVADISGDTHISSPYRVGEHGPRGRRLDGFTVLITGFLCFRPRGYHQYEVLSTKVDRPVRRARTNQAR
jgi:hypothetical protein